MKHFQKKYQTTTQPGSFPRIYIDICLIFRYNIVTKGSLFFPLIYLNSKNGRREVDYLSGLVLFKLVVLFAVEFS